MKHSRFFSILHLFLLLALFLSACNLPFGSAIVPETEVPSLATQELLSTPIQTPEPLIPQNPTIGSTISWFDTSTLVFVPGGVFTMGADEPKEQDFFPAHPVSLNGFWIYSTKVTNEMYNLCVSLGQCTPAAITTEEPGATLSGTSLISYFTGPEDNGYALKDLPATNVTWNQADNYCKWAGGRLPTEAEWEKTARGEESKIQPWGDDTPTCDLLNFEECGGFLSSVLDYPDGMSDYKALDMAGNAYEWVNDWYAKDYYIQSPSSNPSGPVDGEQRSVRGSSFGSEGELVPSYIRISLEPDQYRLDVGFRCVVDDPAVFAPICEAPAQIIADGSTAPEKGTPISVPDVDSLVSLGVVDFSQISLQSNSFCVNQSSKLGGATVKIDTTNFFNKLFSTCVAGGYYMQNLVISNNISSTYEWDFIDYHKGKAIYAGPEGTLINHKFQAVCLDKLSIAGLILSQYKFGVNGKVDFVYAPPLDVLATCQAGYTLQADGTCLYTASKIQPASVSCPGGYSFNEQTQCCTQNPTQSINQSIQYPVCGPGSIFDPQKKVCYKPNGKIITFPMSDFSYPVKLGTCEEPKPKDSDKPSQPQPTPTFCDPATGACP
jgi:formylglycine-generating enzyme required for sulfatase activity